MLTPSWCPLQTALVVSGVAALIPQPGEAREDPVTLPSLCAVLKGPAAAVTPPPSCICCVQSCAWQTFQSWKVKGVKHPGTEVCRGPAGLWVLSGLLQGTLVGEL